MPSMKHKSMSQTWFNDFLHIIAILPRPAMPEGPRQVLDVYRVPIDDAQQRIGLVG